MFRIINSVFMLTEELYVKTSLSSYCPGNRKYLSSAKNGHGSSEGDSQRTSETAKINQFVTRA
jgi:hypothetical protein